MSWKKIFCLSWIFTSALSAHLNYPLSTSLWTHVSSASLISVFCGHWPSCHFFRCSVAVLVRTAAVLLWPPVPLDTQWFKPDHCSALLVFKPPGNRLCRSLAAPTFSRWLRPRCSSFVVVIVVAFVSLLMLLPKWGSPGHTSRCRGVSLWCTGPTRAPLKITHCQFLLFVLVVVHH